MSGSIKVGGHTVFVHTGASGAGTLSVQGQNGNVLLSDDGTAVSFGSNVRLPASGGIKDSSGNDIITESAGVVTLGNTVAVSTFPSGTRMLFHQTASPTGWTKDTTHDNKALRVTSGTAGSGGNSSFNTVFGLTATNNHTLTAAQMPSHSHSTSNSGNHAHSFNRRGLSGAGNYTNDAAAATNASGGTGAQSTNGAGDHSHNTNNAGSGEGHSHGIDLRVQYIDVIIATKN